MRLRYSSILHLLLLAYIIAALSFWWLSLERQSKLIYQNEIAALNEHINPTIYPQEYSLAKEKIALRKSNRSHQYLGEGLTFLVITMIGSWIVYSNYRFSNKLSRQQNNFMLSVTHELKSPIAAMKLTLQTLEKHQLPPEKQLKLLANCIKESDRLNELCDNVLIASKMEGGHYQQVFESTSLTDLLSQTFDYYETRYPGRFTLEQLPIVSIETDKTLLQLVINNVVENAIKYTSAQTTIILSLEVMAEVVKIKISDFGKCVNDS
ncbi:MAG: hypothetical protein IT256_04660 [Chitinophagaceae bacterium]|nr:hypothetical protein [Chitinophagaceae bacterium]